MTKRFHIGYYLAEDKKMISGKTYIAENIYHAMGLFVADDTTHQNIILVKYVVEMDELTN